MHPFTATTLRAFVPKVDRPYSSSIVYEGVFSSRQCARIVEMGLAIGADDALVGTSQEELIDDDEIRKARTAWISPEDETLWIFDKLTRCAQRANRTYRFDLLGFTEDAQFTLYDEPGAFYGWHQDGLEGEVAVRKLSLVVQLSDPADYRGGNLELFNVLSDWDEEDAAEWSEGARRQGSVIVFPAFEYHQVTPLKRGRRYSLVTWIGGPPFR